MRSSYFCAVLLSVLVFCASSTAQLAPIGNSRSSSDRARDRSDAELSRRMSDMHTLERRLELATRQPKGMPVEPKLSDEQREHVLKVRRVSAANLEKYSGFLKQEHTGIFKLFPDLGCISKQVVKVTQECERYVALSSSFTFRTNSYSDEVYHDIRFTNDRLSSSSFFSQGVFTAIGDEPIENIELSHPALKFLTSLEPDVDPKLAAEHAHQFQTGVDSSGYHYADGLGPQQNVTYALRMIAYRLENSLKPLSEQTTSNEMMFLSLTFDKRLDIVVLFRVLGEDENGGLTIVWKELSRNDAAKIKFGKNQTLKDFRPEKK
ncbi:MAG: hypothetical protein ABI481_10140 [Pyrinomonadaceae bacterium]